MQGYRIGRLVLDLDRRQALFDGSILNLTPKSFEILRQLAMAEGRPIPHEVLAKAVWPDTVVQEATVRQNIYSIRTLLRQADPDCEYLETLPKFGYRIAVPVETLTVPATAKHGRNWARSAAVILLALSALGFAELWTSRTTWYPQRQYRAAELTRQGWSILDLRDSERYPAALALFDEGLQLRPDLADAHAGKAVVFALEGNEERAAAEAAAIARLNPESGAPEALRGFFHLTKWEWATAGKSLEAGAARGCPDAFCDQWYAFYLALTGQFPLAIRFAATAVERNPSRLAPRAQYGQILYWAGQNNGALRELRTVVDAGGSATHARLHLWKAQLAAGEREAAAHTLLEAMDPAWYREPAEDEFRRLAGQAEGLGGPGFFARMLDICRRNNINHYYLAEIAMAGGNEAAALDEMERALAAHNFFLPYARRDPLFAALHGNGRFEAVMRKVGL